MQTALDFANLNTGMHDSEQFLLKKNVQDLEKKCNTHCSLVDEVANCSELLRSIYIMLQCHGTNSGNDELSASRCKWTLEMNSSPWLDK